MIKKSLILAALLAIISVSPIKADEGMWLPMLIQRLNQRDLQEMGLQLTPEEIYSVNNSSLKDAIVSMGGFCTGEIISKNGLMLTNHHCGFDAVRANSTVENDYLTDGFWAKSYSEELPNEGLFVSFLVRMEDVTERMLAGLTGDESETERQAKISELGKTIAKEAEGDTNYNARVKSFYAGNEFYLFVYETFNDVRLVGAPPSSIGKYGGDTDNWMWPRQTGDFSMFRVYTAPDGSSAEYSEDNVPLKPKHHLPVSIAGIEEGDFTMTFGYPGSTDRYLTSYGVDQAIEKKNPTIVEIRDAKLAALRVDMEKSDADRLLYASKYAQIANYWKYFIGQTEQLKELKVADSKRALETEFQTWADATPERQAEYGQALQLMKDGYAAKDAGVIGATYSVEGGLRGADAILFTFRYNRTLTGFIAMEEGEEKTKKKEELLASAADFFSGVNLMTDERIFAVTHELYAKNVVADQQPAYMQEVGDKNAGKWDEYAADVYANSIFTDIEKLTAFLDKPKEKTLAKDPMRIVADDLMAVYRNARTANTDANDMISKGDRLFQAGLQEMMPEKDFYPNANSTMRASFGNVKEYYPADGVTYKFYTTMDGLMAKEDPNNPEFIVPAKLKELYEAKDYGQYADKDGTLHVNFISTNDITGGNSGSPVINGKGELIGLAFDGNWEAMSGDINFETSVQRTISVDIRYVLFVIDKYAGATNLIEEMTLVRATPVAQAEPATVKPNTQSKGEPAMEPTMN